MNATINRRIIKASGKRSQITVFIIIGLMLLLVIGLLSALLQGIGPYNKTPEQSKVQEYVSNCLSQTTAEGAVILAAQGSRFDPEKYVILENLTVAAGYEMMNTLATKQELEQELAEYIDSYLPACTNFSTLNIDVHAGTPKTKVTLEDEKIIINTKWPLEWSNTTENKFYAQAGIPLGRVYSKAVWIIENLDPGWIDLSTLSDTGDITILPVGDGWFIYLIKDDLLFSFAAKYDINSAPVMDMPDEFILEDEKPWLYRINCTDVDEDKLRITDDTAMFDTLPDGSILFTPHIPGSYDVTFECRDEKHTTKRTVRFIVR